MTARPGRELVPKDETRDEDSAHTSLYAKERDQIFSALTILNNKIAELQNLIMGGQTPHVAMQLPSVIQRPVNNSQDNTKIIKVNTSDDDDTPLAEEENGPISLEELTKHRIIETLERFNGNRSKAAKELGISDRTLYRKIKEYELKPKKKQNPTN